MAHKIVYYAAKKGFWIYIGTNGRVLRPEVADRLADAGVAVFNFALDAWDEKPGLPKALIPAQKNLEYLMRKQYTYGYMVFFNMNICRNNLDDIRLLTEYAREHRLATDYHLNETPMIEQDGHFKHLHENPTYIRPEDWRAVDALIDWLIEKNMAGYQMVNSVPRLREMKAFMRMSSGLDLRQVGWYGDGAGADSGTTCSPGCLASFAMRMAAYDLRIGTAGPARTMASSPTAHWARASRCIRRLTTGGTIEGHKFNGEQMEPMKKTCQKHCFSTLNHNLGYCYNDARVLKWLWKQAANGFKGGARSFED